MSVVVDGSGDARMQEYSKLAADLEQQELEATNGIASPQAYGQLLAIYLLQNDLPNAKFLWKRIPQEIKQSHTELGNIWKVGQGLWFKDFPAVYNVLSQEWPDHVKPIMQELGERTRRRALILVAKAYSSISLDDASCFLGIPKLELADVVSSLGWSIDATNGMVLPTYTEHTRRRALILVAKAYSSISLDDASCFLGIPKLELADGKKVASSLGWSIDATNGTLVRHEDSTPSEEQLAKLTDFVAFLEN
ncbi:hypothetical protein MRX96_032160 [Rhipicephalus microplus]|uniref:COP9 signalosome complex subunit 8 isoform X2 n=1 Tax=Rhipicephalus microplus TaxID=6941 RepID=UPI003F6C6D92